MKQVILKVDGMSCSACQNTVEKYLNKQDGVNASVNLVMAQALIDYDETKVTIEDLERYIKESGYKSLGIYDEKEEEKQDNTKTYLILLGIVIILLMYVSMSHMLSLPMIPYLDKHNYPINYGIAELILTLPLLIYGTNIITSGINKLIHKHPNMDSLVTIGIISSFTYSLINLIKIILGNDTLMNHLYFESSAMIIYFLNLGRYIDKLSKGHTKEAIKDLVTITPETALLKTKTGEKIVTIDEVHINDILICKPGMKIAVDGRIVKGSTHVDESFITGESLPSKKKEKDKVIAGSMNIDGSIEYIAEGIGPNSTISSIVRLVSKASNTKAPIQRIADIVSGYFVPGIIIIAILTLFINLLIGTSFNDSLISFVNVLVVSCPCALGLATPLAIIVSIGVNAKKGILIKDGETLENIHKIDTIVFDKTGTLTYGKLKISEINKYSEYKEEDLLKLVAALEHNSTHPIATSFEEYYDKNIKVTDFKNIEGIGIKGTINKEKVLIGSNKIIKELSIKNDYKEQEDFLASLGNTIIYVIKNNRIIALIGVKDIIRIEAKETINQLLKMNKQVIMLSGDNEKTAKLIASTLNINKIKANVLPSEKESYLQELMKNHKVMMVGDGINDAPSLTSADIGVSMNSGTDIAGESSDIILMKDDLSKIIDVINISKSTITIIKQNLFWAFFYNICMIPIATGLLKPLGITLSPMIASLAMTISSITVVLNSLRLRKKYLK